jgi:hypothetical protein
MHLTPAHISPIAALVAGVLILVAPRLLYYVVAIYLIVVGLIGLNGIYHFVRRALTPSDGCVASPTFFARKTGR